jgi:hypothetical protein
MKKLANDECNWSSQQLRALNEAPTLLLVTIVMLVVFKNSFPTTVTPWLIFGLIVVMAASISSMPASAGWIKKRPPPSSLRKPRLRRGLPPISLRKDWRCRISA